MAGHDQHRILPRSREPSGTRIRQGHPSPPMGRCGPARRRRHYGLHRPPPRPRRRRRTRRDRPRPGQRHPHRTSDHLAAPMAQRKARRAPDHRVPGRHPGAPHTRWRPNPPARHHSHHRLVSEGGASEVLALSAGVAPVRPGAAAQRDHPASCTAFVHAARPWPCCATWTPPAPASMTLSTPPQSLKQHPDAGIMTSFPVPGSLTGARVLAEIGDDRPASARATRRLPRRVYLTEGDRLLALDLDQPGHRVLLRAHLDGGAPAVLTEAPGNLGWCGGREHEIVVLLKAAGPPAWPRLPKPARARIIAPCQGQAPAISSVLLASLYGDLRRQDVILAEYLPALLDRLGQPPWWYVRFRDPDQHLRLRIALSDPEEFGQLARAVSTCCQELHHAGLLREVRYATSYPETGRWGSGAAWAAAEDVFRADSRAVLTQLGQPTRPHRRSLAAAHTFAIASAFLGSTAAGARWLIDHIPLAAPEPVPRDGFADAVRIADPRRNWAALRAAAGGPAIVQAWANRDHALAGYRRHLPGPDTHGIDTDDVLNSLLHVHFVRAVAIDFTEEATCLHLARAAALAWTARTTRRPA